MRRLVLLLLCLTVTAGCGGIDSRERDRDDGPGNDLAEQRDHETDDFDIDPTDPESVAGAIGQMFGGGGERAETVDFRVLRDLLPEALGGLERTDVSGERNGIAGLSFSNASADYRDGDRHLSVQITDGGGLGQMALLGATWMQMEVDREDGDGYERTTTFEGYPALETFETRGRQADLQFVVGQRFFVSVEGHGMAMEEVKDAVGEIDLDELEEMQDEGV